MYLKVLDADYKIFSTLLVNLLLESLTEVSYKFSRIETNEEIQLYLHFMFHVLNAFYAYMTLIT